MSVQQIMSNIMLIIFIIFGIFGIIKMSESDRDFSSIDNIPELQNSFNKNWKAIQDNYNGITILENDVDNLEKASRNINKTINDIEQRLTKLEQENKQSAYNVVGECVLVYEENNETICLGVKK